MPYIEVLQKYAVFDGRAKRSEYWLFMLIHVIISIILGLIPLVLDWFLVVEVVYFLALLVPVLAVGARRLHDSGKSGWLQLILLIPLIGWIIVIILMALPSDDENQYGPRPV
ncbi:MAG: DUF805 domain-containing protein [Dehalococcoidia bacterium]|nr:DUF805 domain-containing protein [Dehalococcoidia bacterium]MXY20160.1 DUF805 domain-containing protein [Dehalococcoidia bacterium]